MDARLTRWTAQAGELLRGASRWRWGKGKPAQLGARSFRPLGAHGFNDEAVTFEAHVDLSRVGNLSIEPPESPATKTIVSDQEQRHAIGLARRMMHQRIQYIGERPRLIQRTDRFEQTCRTGKCR